MKRVSDLTLTSASCEKACVQELRGCMEQQKSVEVSRMEVMRTMIGRERQRVGGSESGVWGGGSGLRPTKDTGVLD
jgi:hypothetical protein